MDHNLKKFWNIVKIKSKRSSLPSELHHNNVKTSTAFEKPTLFNNYFKDSFNGNIHDIPEIHGFRNDNLNVVRIHEDQVLKVLLNLSTSNVFGVDGISPLIDKNCAFTLYKSITKLLNLSRHLNGTGCTSV